MFDEEELQSPPYPPETCPSRSLLRHIDELRDWVLHYRDSLNAIADNQEEIPFPREIPTHDAYESVSVVDKYTTLNVMRRIREAWDHLIRSNEENWNAESSIEGRSCLVRYAASLFSEAFVDSETREAKTETERKKFMRWEQAVKNALGKVIEGTLDSDIFDDDDGPPDIPDFTS